MSSSTPADFGTNGSAPLLDPSTERAGGTQFLTTVVMNGNDDTMVWDGLPPGWPDDQPDDRLMAVGSVRPTRANSRHYGVLGALSGPSGVVAEVGGWLSASLVSFASLVMAKVLLLVLVPLLKLIAGVLLLFVGSVL